MTVAALTLADLRRVDLFDDLDDERLGQWLAVAEPYDVGTGHIVVRQDETPQRLELLLEGTMRSLVTTDAGRTEPVGRQIAPTWMGAIALLTDGPLGVTVEAETPCRMAAVPGPDFIRLVFAQPEVHRRVMRQVAPVMTRVTSIEQNRERLAGLGTMAAGLAHELNNPAAAATRAAAELAEALDVLASTVGHFVESGIERETAQELVALQRQALEHAAACSTLDVLDASDAEDALLEQLEALGIDNAWQLAEPLAVSGADAAWLARLSAIAGPATQPALEWIAASLTARNLVGELSESTAQMSRLVGAVKTYAYMDRGGLVEADVHEGLETTLVVLGHKLKHTRIEIVREYDRNLPKITVRGSELNQVWTNLLDNAIGALGESGTITLTTRRDGDCAVIEIADDGPGIPPDVIGHVFDPFFTTKGVGQGTGLGLDTARRIVVDRHDGSIAVDSEPGRTTFHVRLPIPST